MNKPQIKIDIANSVAPDGYEFTGEYRQVEKGEYCLFPWGALLMREKTCAHYPILRKIKPKRWRAGPKGIYFYVDGDATVRDHIDRRDEIDEHLYAIGNHFRTEVEADEVAELFKQTLANYWEKKGFEL